MKMLVTNNGKYLRVPADIWEEVTWTDNPNEASDWRGYEFEGEHYAKYFGGTLQLLNEPKN